MVGDSPREIKPIPSYTTRDIGTEFEIVPFINEKNEILLNIKITVSTLEKGSQKILVPDAYGNFNEPLAVDGVAETTIETTLVTTHGKGIVLGGLINETTSKQESKVPLLGDVPVLGFFFNKTTDVTTKSEMVVILTPYIVDLKNPDAHKTIDVIHKSIEKDKDIFHEVESEPTGNKLIDNVLKEN
jgi:general secretion pathway protein D